LLPPHAMRPLPSPLLLCSLLLPSLGLVACGSGDDSLAASGNVTVEAAGSSTGFSLPSSTLLIVEGFENPAGEMEGRCEIGAGDLLLSVGRPEGAAGPGIALSHFELYVPNEGPAEVQAILGADTYVASGGPTCSVQTPYVDAARRTARASISCELRGPAAQPATLEADLTFTGCLVH